MFDKMLQISMLYDFYGQLLTEKQQEIVQLYYGDDLSLGEISEQLGISRQAVYDTIKRTEKILFEYEEKLGLVNRFTSNNRNIEEILRIVEGIENNYHIMTAEVKFVLEEIARIKQIANEILEK
ncbi:hypothetical protein HNQ80_003927 [Anaerosolibacter carboniphilus]|uniref:UPF0122 protein HNQ80_003927 n=1 Tax=Anaerosolibacter carboniphilus TaxID=1417629 RepID=A0A841KVY6_9FIRM|nr:putative DNA-binding protein [Anaerosolibacter carboniphilus]MBB6217804.1 hypothetical protein [Anaerosolibacter carboniphilus]